MTRYETTMKATKLDGRIFVGTEEMGSMNATTQEKNECSIRSLYPGIRLLETSIAQGAVPCMPIHLDVL